MQQLLKSSLQCDMITDVTCCCLCFTDGARYFVANFAVVIERSASAWECAALIRLSARDYVKPSKGTYSRVNLFSLKWVEVVVEQGILSLGHGIIRERHLHTFCCENGRKHRLVRRYSTRPVPVRQSKRLSRVLVFGFDRVGKAVCNVDGNGLQFLLLRVSLPYS